MSLAGRVFVLHFLLYMGLNDRVRGSFFSETLFWTASVHCMPASGSLFSLLRISCALMEMDDVLGLQPTESGVAGRFCCVGLSCALPEMHGVLGLQPADHGVVGRPCCVDHIRGALAEGSLKDFLHEDLAFLEVVDFDGAHVLAAVLVFHPGFP